MKRFYESPRWSYELLDCSLPMSLDTYNKCSYNCLYCFSYFQKSHSMGKGGTKKGKHNYQAEDLSWVNPQKIKDMFSLKKNTSFSEYIKKRIYMQWGGLADQFDENERKHRITLELMKFFKDINYPITFSTKGTWWGYDDEYREVIRNKKEWYYKISIINLDEKIAKKIELGTPSPQERLKLIKELSKLNVGGITLRLRPFIIGMSDVDEQYLDLIRLAKENGADSVSTEFFCLDPRADSRLKERYLKMAKALNFDIFKFYREQSTSTGFFRLNREIKYPFFLKMANLCKSLNMRFYVSDAHWKEMSNNACCCGLPESCNYYRGQFSEALQIIKKNGEASFDDFEDNILDSFKDIPIKEIVHVQSEEYRFHKKSIYDYIKTKWNFPNQTNSPYRYFNGIIKPFKKNKNGNLVYKFNTKKENEVS